MDVKEMDIEDKVHIGTDNVRLCDGQKSTKVKEVTDDMVGCVPCLKAAVEEMVKYQAMLRDSAPWNKFLHEED